MVEELRSLLKYVAVVGLAPATQEPGRQRLQRVVTLLVMLLYFAATVYGALRMQQQQRSLVSHLVGMLLYASTVCTWTTIVLETLLTYEPHWRFYERSQRVRRHFGQPPLLATACRRTLWRQQLRRLTLFLVVVCGCHAAKLYLVHWHRGPQRQQRQHTTLLHYLLPWPAMLVIRLRCLQILLYADYINHYVRMLNGKLEALATPRRRCKGASALDYLLALKRLHQQLYELCLLFNELFGWSLVFLVALIFFAIIVNAYWACHVIVSLAPGYTLTLAAVTIVPKVMMLCMLCACGERLVVQQRQSTTFVRRLIAGNSSWRDCHDVAGEFALQLMQNRMEIDAKQFFTFNLKLLMELVVALITYLVILLQFCTTAMEDGLPEDNE